MERWGALWSKDRQGFRFHSIFLTLSLQRVHCLPNSCLKTWSHLGVLCHHSRARGFHPQQHSGFSLSKLPKMSQTPMLGIWGAPSLSGGSSLYLPFYFTLYPSPLTLSLWLNISHPLLTKHPVHLFTQQTSTEGWLQFSTRHWLSTGDAQKVSDTTHRLLIRLRGRNTSKPTIEI